MMAPSTARGRAREPEDLVEPGVKDVDPEEDAYYSEGESESNVSEDNEDAARDHYVAVGKSKLRKPAEAALGSQYQGSRIGRHEVEHDDDEDDPFDKGFDDLESDLGEFDVVHGDDSSYDSQSEGGEGSDENGTADTDLDDEDHANVPFQNAEDEEGHKKMREALKAELLSASTASLAQANKDDAEKGRAVTKQRGTFDSLLNLRMKLQKSLIATNTLVGNPREQVVDNIRSANEAMEAAETAAFNLWSSLNSLREDLIASRAGHKRKRILFSDSTPTMDLWKHMQNQEANSRPQRDGILQKWSKKSQGPGRGSDRGLLKPSEQQTLVLDVIREQLSNTERLIKRTRLPRSCAPLQASQIIAEDEKIYDDADFYGLLLKELLEQKANGSLAAANVDISWQMRRDNKTKKTVDTKASKGRKLRFTVHEKLQNFMAPEDRGSWGVRQSDELFGSLFGQRLGLAEEDADAASDDGIDPEETGLMMFRS